MSVLKTFGQPDLTAESGTDGPSGRSCVNFFLNHEKYMRRDSDTDPAQAWTAQQVWMNLAADGDLKILVQSFKVFQIDYSAQTLIQDMGLIDL